MIVRIGDNAFPPKHFEKECEEKKVHKVIKDCSDVVKSIEAMISECSADEPVSIALKELLERTKAVADNNIMKFYCPERMLDMRNQRKLVHVLSMLENHGVKISIATESDIIIRELNLMIALKYRREPIRERILKRFNLNESCLLSTNKIECTEYRNGKIVKCDVSRKWGIDSEVLGTQIEEFNKLNSAVRWEG